MGINFDLVQVGVDYYWIQEDGAAVGAGDRDLSYPPSSFFLKMNEQVDYLNETIRRCNNQVRELEAKIEEYKKEFSCADWLLEISKEFD